MNRRRFTLPIPMSLLLLLSMIFGPTSTVHAASVIQDLPLNSPFINSQLNPSVPVEFHDPDVAQAWMNLLYERVSVIGIYPPTAARVYAYTSIALYEATAAGTPQLDSLGGRLNEMPLMPEADPALNYDWPLVVNAAVASVSEPILVESTVRTLFNSMNLEQVKLHVARLRDQVVDQRSATIQRDVVERSIQLGMEIGSAIGSWAATDGFAEASTRDYITPSGEEALWVPVPLNADPIAPYWHTLRPLALEDNKECNMPLMIDFSTDIHSPFYRQALEIYHTSIKLTDEERSIADFWDDQAGEAGMHPGHWMLIADQIVDQLNLDLAEAAQIYMLTGIALHESAITAWTGKYDTLVIRPETYIQRYIDPLWEPFLDTPNFPEYPSGHATFGAASAEVIGAVWGTISLIDHSGVVDGMGRSRTFTSLEAAAYENGLSRLYGGIHYRMGMEAGLSSGECVGERVVERLLGESP